MENALRIAFAAVLGLAFGSFLTVVIHRTPRRESIVAPRSACPHCGVTISSRDNIPVVSYLLLGGRCRSCGAQISAQYPLIEAMTGVLFVAAAVVFDRVWVAATVAPFLGLMLACGLIDLRHRIIPNRLVYPSLVIFALAIVALAAGDQRVSLVTAGLGFLAYGGGFLALALAYPRGLGMGDVKLAALIGLVLGALGWRYVGVAAVAAVIVGGLAGLLLLARGGTRKDAMPFGPHLAVGAVLSALAGPTLANWYLRALG